MSDHQTDTSPSSKTDESSSTSASDESSLPALPQTASVGLSQPSGDGGMAPPTATAADADAGVDAANPATATDAPSDGQTGSSPACFLPVEGPSEVSSSGGAATATDGAAIPLVAPASSNADGNRSHREDLGSDRSQSSDDNHETTEASSSNRSERDSLSSTSDTVEDSSSGPSVDQRDGPDVSSGSDFESSSESAHFDATQDDHISDGAAPSLEDLSDVRTNAVQESFEGSDPGALPSVEADDTSGDSADLGSQLLAQNVGPKADINSGTSDGMTWGNVEPGSGNSAGSSDHSLEELGEDLGQTAASSVAGELGPNGQWAAGVIGKAIGGLVGSALDIMFTPTGQPDEPGRAPDAVGQAAGMSAAGTYGTGGVSKAAPEQNQSITPDAEGVTTVPTEGGRSTQ